jgi:hypothetical protein
MGRNKKFENEKKVKIGICIDPEVIIFLKSNSVNVSSLVNKLLIDYIKDVE